MDYGTVVPLVYFVFALILGLAVFPDSRGRGK